MKKIVLAAIISGFAFGATAGSLEMTDEQMDQEAEPMVEEPVIEDSSSDNQGLMYLLLLALLGVAAVAL